MDGLKLIVQFRFPRTFVLLKTLLRAASPLGDFRHGAVAQLVERLLCKQDVRSSSLLTSTDYQNPHLQNLEYELVWIVI